MSRRQRVRSFSREAYRRLRERAQAYRDPRDASAWLGGNRERVRRLFEDTSLRDFVFEPFGSLASAAGEHVQLASDGPFHDGDGVPCRFQYQGMLMCLATVECRVQDQGNAPCLFAVTGGELANVR